MGEIMISERTLTPLNLMGDQIIKIRTMFNCCPSHRAHDLWCPDPNKHLPLLPPSHAAPDLGFYDITLSSNKIFF